jgi:Tol biopolymer transport system component
MSKTRFTQTGKTSMVALSPDGKYLALVQEDAGRRSLWVRQVAAGGGVQIIGPTQDHFRGLTYSPDGNYLFYVSGKPRSPVRSVYRVPALGGTVTKLVEDVDTPITFAPDGARFAFVRHDPSRAEASLFIANADGTGVTRIFTKKYPDFLYTPAWSPDGRRFACILGIWGRAGSVIEVGVEGGPERPLTEKRWVWATELSWFADGRGLLLVGTDNRSRRSQLWEIDYPSGEARLLTRDNNDYDQASLSGDSQLLAAVQLQFLANLWIAPVSGPGRARPITTGAGRYLSAAWSAEGRIVYSSLESGNWDIWSINLRGADPRQLTSEARANFFPAPTPDGRYLVITSDRGGAPDLWRLNPDGSQPKQLTKKGSAEYPACTPDGRWVVFSSSAPESILWKVSIDGGEAVQLTRGFASHPAVSPDGKLIAAVYREEMGDRPPALALIPISGGAPAKELRLPVTFEAPLRWTRDGRAVSYVVHGEGASNIWSQPIAGGPARQVTDFRRDHIGSFDWSPDGREIVLVRGLVVRDAYLLRGFR